MKKQMKFVIAIMATAMITGSVFAQKKYKNTTKIPSNITTPDKVETSIGTLKLF